MYSVQVEQATEVHRAFRRRVSPLEASAVEASTVKSSTVKSSTVESSTVSSSITGTIEHVSKNKATRKATKDRQTHTHAPHTPHAHTTSVTASVAASKHSRTSSHPHTEGVSSGCSIHWLAERPSILRTVAGTAPETSKRRGHALLLECLLPQASLLSELPHVLSQKSVTATATGTMKARTSSSRRLSSRRLASRSSLVPTALSLSFPKNPLSFCVATGVPGCEVGLAASVRSGTLRREPEGAPEYE